MAKILKGSLVCKKLSDELQQKKEELLRTGIVPTLAIVRLGNREADLSFEKSVVKRSEKNGIKVNRFVLPENCSKIRLMDLIRSINEDTKIHACIILRPLPDPGMEAEVCDLLSPKKDVDGVTNASILKLFMGQENGFKPCTAEACMEILKFYGYDLKGKKVVILGRSMVIGKPVAMLCLSENATITICHSKSENLPDICKDSDFLISATGHAGLVTKEFTNSRQVIIDVGINFDSQGKLCGDVLFSETEPICRAITPVPGGVGVVTGQILIKHVIEAAWDAES